MVLWSFSLTVALWLADKNLLFVHVPKTGGMSLRTLFASGACPGAAHERAQAHTLVESRVRAAGKTPVVVIREPFERLHSAFEFWRSGSELPSMRSLRNSQTSFILRELVSRLRQVPLRSVAVLLEEGLQRRVQLRGPVKTPHFAPERHRPVTPILPPQGRQEE